MTVEELKSVIVYLQGKVEELEQRKICECDSEKEEIYHNGVKGTLEDIEPTDPTVTYVTNYNEDEECLTCSA